MIQQLDEGIECPSKHLKNKLRRGLKNERSLLVLLPLLSGSLVTLTSLDWFLTTNTHIERGSPMKILTLEDYQKAGEHFWSKYGDVAKELGEGAKTEDILKVMESLGGVFTDQKRGRW